MITDRLQQCIDASNKNSLLCSMKAFTPRWRDYLMSQARLAATMSKDTTKVGAVLADHDGRMMLSAFNGLPAGVEDRPERLERPTKYRFVSHAENNLVCFAARAGVRTANMLLITTHYPCSRCAVSIIQAGISCVVVGDGQTNMPAEEFETAATMFAEARVMVEALK